ncbi:MAG: helix-turn-helix transcriptional regulator [Clostridia bacterium]|nr:helix-turn-helix transcriptional regulator [Clostridia bacterium]
MNDIGKRIKELRKKNDFTQEKLADFLGVSYKAVSKWECGVSVPDISLIISLAKLFRVSTDDLLGVNVADEDARRDEIEAMYKKTWETGDLEERHRVAKIGVAEFPGDMKYVGWLGWTTAMLSFSYADDETYRAEQEKAIKLFERVIENAMDERIKASAIQGIVQYLSFRGRDAEAFEYAKQYPENYSMSREDVMLTCLHGEEKKILTQKMLDRHLSDMLNLIECKSMEACIAQEQVINAIIPDGNYLYYNTFLVDNYVSRAVFYMRDNETEKAMDALKTAHKFAIDYDSFLSDHQTYRFTSPFLNAEERNTADICRSGTSTHKEDLIERVKRSGFDALKDREDFKALLK